MSDPRDWSSDFGSDFGPASSATIGTGATATPAWVPATFGTPSVIPSYLYFWYKDDDDLQAFVRAYNDQAQGMVDWFNQVGLADWTSPQVIGGLLDWVAQGLYGMPRPVLHSGRTQWVGGLNTAALDTIPFNALTRTGSLNYYAVDDDIFKRILTWHLWKGDGKQFNFRWLKRRIMRFLTGVNGTAGEVDQTYQISVTIGVSDDVNIRLLLGARNVTGGAILDGFAPNSQAFNALQTSVVYYPSLGPVVQTFIDAVNANALELPFQYSYFVSITNPTVVTK